MSWSGHTTGSWYDANDGWQWVTSSARCMQAEVLYSNYGNKSNEELILGYGFALRNNVADFFHVMIGFGQKPSAEAGTKYGLKRTQILRELQLYKLGKHACRKLDVMQPLSNSTFRILST